MFESNLKDEIKNRLKISEIISKKITLNKKGENNYIALCPFHNEKTPSFSVQDDKGFYHCFGCGKHGDIFNFVMEIDNLDFKEALKYLSGQAGITYANSMNTSNLKPLKVLEEAKNQGIRFLINGVHRGMYGIEGSSYLANLAMRIDSGGNFCDMM